MRAAVVALCLAAALIAAAPGCEDDSAYKTGPATASTVPDGGAGTGGGAAGSAGAAGMGGGGGGSPQDAAPQD